MERLVPRHETLNRVRDGGGPDWAKQPRMHVANCAGCAYEALGHDGYYAMLGSARLDQAKEALGQIEGSEAVRDRIEAIKVEDLGRWIARSLAKTLKEEGRPNG